MNSLYAFLRARIIPLERIDEVIPSTGYIVDLGCGQGLIATYLANKSKRMVLGIDANEKRLPKSKKRNLRFAVGDITTTKLKSPNAVILSDVLHHLEKKTQIKLIGEIHKSLEKGGVLVIKEIDTEEFLRSKLSRFWDWVIYPNDKISFSSSKELMFLLKKTGFVTTMSRQSRIFPGSTTLYFCKK